MLIRIYDNFKFVVKVRIRVDHMKINIGGVAWKR